MDPSIVKLLEDDEDWQDETEGSRREVEAFQAALSRDIGGDAAATFQTSESNPGLQMEAASQSGNVDSQVQPSQQEQNSSEIQVKKEPLNIEKQIYNKVLIAPQMKPQENHNYEAAADRDPNQISQVTGVPVSESNPTLNNEPDRVFNRDSESQFLKLQKMSNQQATILDRTSNQNNRGGGKQVPFAVLLPVLLPQLDKDRAMQLQTLFNRLKKNEIIKDDFVRLMRSVVGDQMLRLAVSKVHFQSATNHFQLQTPPAAQQLPPRMAPISAGATNLTDRQSFAQLHQKGANSSAISNLHLSAAQGQPNTGYVKTENSEESSQEGGRQSTGNPLSSSISGANQGTRREQSSATIQGLEKPPQQQIPFQQKAFSMYGTGSNASNYQPSSGSSITTSTSSFKSPSQELQMRQVPQHRSISAQLGGSLSGMNMGDQGSGTTGSAKDESSEKQSSKMGFTTTIGGPSTSGNVFPSSTVSPNITTQVDSNAMLESRNPSITVASGVNRTPPKKPSVGQKKPLETVGASPPPSSKKQKLATFSDQSIEHLNDVTAVSGVNIREEEEQLFSGVKDDLRVSEASRRVVQEEEERLILQKTPLQKKLSEIMVKCGLKGISKDAERCLSLCVEERMRGLITNLIRLSKQRVDVELPRHKTIITSDVRHRIMMMNWKAKEEWEKKQAEVEKLRKLNEPEDSNGNAADKEKDDGRTKAVKVNRDQDDKMRTTAANVAARAAVGGDDMLSKWQLMAEQARQKREGGTDGHGASSSSQPVKDVARKPTSNLGRNSNDSQEVEKKGPTRKIGRNQVMAPQPGVARSICVKDVIAVLEREPQMSKSTMLYRLYEKIRSEGNAD